MVKAAECPPTEVSDPLAAALLVPSDTGASGSECAHRRQVLSAAIALIIAEMLWPADFTCEICEVPLLPAPGACGLPKWGGPRWRCLCVAGQDRRATHALRCMRRL